MVEKRSVITTSWDDGHKESLRIAKLLKNYGLKGTFYVPVNAVLGRKVEMVSSEGPFLSKSEFKILAKDFEIGGHGVTHQYLTGLTLPEIRKEIRESKEILEKISGQKIHGFAYPGGDFNRKIVDEVKKAGYVYARTIEEGRLKFRDRFRVPVTIFCQNELLYRTIGFTLRAPFSDVFAVGGDWGRCVLKAYKTIKEKGGILHIAGHPNEFRNRNFQKKIEKILSKIGNDQNIEYLTNFETYGK